MEEKNLRYLISAFALIMVGIFIGYFWCYRALADYEVPVKAGWALAKSDPVRLAMNRMGPRHHYKMIGERLYVNTGDGVWLRLRY